MRDVAVMKISSHFDFASRHREIEKCYLSEPRRGCGSMCVCVCESVFFDSESDFYESVEKRFCIVAFAVGFCLCCN